MKAKTRARSSAAIVTATVWSAVVMVVAASPAAEEWIVRFVNGREIVVRGHWVAGSQLLFTHKLGTLGVPRELVAAIEPLPAAKKIGGAPQAVNAPTLVAPEPFR